MTIKFRYKEPDADVSKMESVVVNDSPVTRIKHQGISASLPLWPNMACYCAIRNSNKIHPSIS
jgi:hypothetical protein